MATLSDRLTLAAWNAAMEGRGNVKLVWGSYTGTGEYNSTSNSLIFDGRPLYIELRSTALSSGQSSVIMRYCSTVATNPTASNATMNLFWGENSVFWHAGNAEAQCNVNNREYYYFALVGM